MLNARVLSRVCPATSDIPPCDGRKGHEFQTGSGLAALALWLPVRGDLPRLRLGLGRSCAVAVGLAPSQPPVHGVKLWQRGMRQSGLGFAEVRPGARVRP